VELQVLRRGSMFAMRAQQLYRLYQTYDGIEALPGEERERLESQVFRRPLDEIWKECVEYFSRRDPDQLRRAADSPKRRMALVFRWYLGMASRWAVTGQADRTADYQIWCGPAMGAFNRWTAGSHLAAPANRSVAQIALNLLEGAAVVTRAQQLRCHGVPVPASAFAVTPRPLS
jgi:PfaD family protein